MVRWFAEAAERFGQAMESTDPGLRQAVYDVLNVRAYFTPGSNESASRSPSVTGGERRVGGGT